MSQITKAQAEAAIKLAESALDSDSPYEAHKALALAKNSMDRDVFEAAYWASLESLMHSVGSFNKAYQDAVRLI